MTPPTIIHHKAALDGQYPPNSLEAIRACLEANAPFIEVDIVALAQADYLLVHDPLLETETSGTGTVAKTDPAHISALRIKHDETITPYTPALLSDVVALFNDYSSATRLQLDFKDVIPASSTESLERLIAMIQPLGERVIISSCADWQLRRIRKLAAWVDLGFDPLFYLAWRPEGSPVDPRYPPFKRGAYGYYDDHVLAAQRSWSAADYLAERFDIFARLVPGVSTFYVDHRLLMQMLDEGFNAADMLHSLNIKLDTWTVDADKPAAVTNARRLLDAGVDLFTTNTPVEMAALLV